jgi:hypothetical protein
MASSFGTRQRETCSCCHSYMSSSISIPCESEVRLICLPACPSDPAQTIEQCLATFPQHLFLDRLGLIQRFKVLFSSFWDYDPGGCFRMRGRGCLLDLSANHSSKLIGNLCFWIRPDPCKKLTLQRLAWLSNRRSLHHPRHRNLRQLQV